jgi:hypothetical protein
MAIYTTDTYEILSIMKSFETDTQSGVVTFDQGGLHIQGLPTSNYAHIVPIGIRKTHGLVEENSNIPLLILLLALSLCT